MTLTHSRSAVSESLNILDSVLKSRKSVTIAYSGGKDSTALALLLPEWVTSRGKPLNITILHGDTSSEIPEVEHWARRFSQKYIEMLKETGSNGRLVIVRPEPWESFYWRVLVRGYAAPTFNWRWCVYLLKRLPSLRFLEKAPEGSVMLLGHRDSESQARAKTLSSRAGSCPLKPGSCFSYYLSTDGSVKKVYPLRGWSDRDVWQYLKLWREKLDILEELFKLYGYGLIPARFGCWHCTLVKVQLGHEVLGGGHLYFEAVRKIYRAVSDIPELRETKNKGYSKLGPLKASARSLILHAMLEAEKLSGIKLYGLDETTIEGYTLRQILTEIPSKEADKIIKRIELLKRGDLSRIKSVEELRDINRHKKELKKIWEHRLVKFDKYTEEILSRVLGNAL